MIYDADCRKCGLEQRDHYEVQVTRTRTDSRGEYKEAATAYICPTALYTAKGYVEENV